MWARSRLHAYIDQFPFRPEARAQLFEMIWSDRDVLPGIAPGHTMEDIVLARFDYAQIDRPEQSVRTRLNSTAVDVRNVERGVEVAYVNGGNAARVAARDCVLACYHAMIPYIAPETADAQCAAPSTRRTAPSWS